MNAALADEVRAIAESDKALTGEINRTASWHSLDARAVQNQVNYRVATFERLLELALAACDSEGGAACLGCGRDDSPRSMITWRDADGEGHWMHPECLPSRAAGGES
ncbi:hypothetical protein GS928_25125 [Rhodococcus hoagii]|nr:hypothetical protein [Prescottella equi]NKS67445.1 hypothetical protein [Prescottella equi]NKU15229.1 hypothetical protein [Prescottella equi]NKU15267.1 hypothetical protein [Prescottella equi]NKU15294.1 hypothetical protein [Prescottella equi]